MERPIIFSTEMVKAILDGRKTMTRRVVKPQPPHDKWRDDYGHLHIPDLVKCCPYGQVGDRLWVRETWRLKVNQMNFKYEGVLYYKADGLAPPQTHWRPSIFMPRWASRITLEITEVRVERLQGISASDCAEEGLQRTGDIIVGGKDMKERFKILWDFLNAQRGYGWETNPWVWVIGFKVIK